MNTQNRLDSSELLPDLEALQFESLVEAYVDLGLNRFQAAAAAQADYLCANRLAFSRRGTMGGSYFLADSGLAA